MQIFVQVLKLFCKKREINFLGFSKQRAQYVTHWLTIMLVPVPYSDLLTPLFSLLNSIGSYHSDYLHHFALEYLVNNIFTVMSNAINLDPGFGLNLQSINKLCYGVLDQFFWLGPRSQVAIVCIVLKLWKKLI